MAVLPLLAAQLKQSLCKRSNHRAFLLISRLPLQHLVLVAVEVEVLEPSFPPTAMRVQTGRWRACFPLGESRTERRFVPLLALVAGMTQRISTMPLLRAHLSRWCSLIQVH